MKLNRTILRAFLIRQYIGNKIFLYVNKIQLQYLWLRKAVPLEELLPLSGGLCHITTLQYFG